MNNIKMLYFDRIDVSEEIDVNKISKSKECDICHYWYFLNKGFNPIHHFGLCSHDMGVGTKCTPLKISKTKNDLSVKLSFCLF